MMCDTAEDLKSAAGWPGQGIKSRQKLTEKLQGNISERLVRLIILTFILPLTLHPTIRPSTPLSHAFIKFNHPCIYSSIHPSFHPFHPFTHRLLPASPSFIHLLIHPPIQYGIGFVCDSTISELVMPCEFLMTVRVALRKHHTLRYATLRLLSKLAFRRAWQQNIDNRDVLLLSWSKFTLGKVLDSLMIDCMIGSRNSQDKPGMTGMWNQVSSGCFY